jgi:hypothetical protein
MNPERFENGFKASDLSAIFLRYKSSAHFPSPPAWRSLSVVRIFDAWLGFLMSPRSSEGRQDGASQMIGRMSMTT